VILVHDAGRHFSATRRKVPTGCRLYTPLVASRRRLLRSPFLLHAYLPPSYAAITSPTALTSRFVLHLPAAVCLLLPRYAHFTARRFLPPVLCGRTMPALRTTRSLTPRAYTTCGARLPTYPPRPPVLRVFLARAFLLPHTRRHRHRPHTGRPAGLRRGLPAHHALQHHNFRPSPTLHSRHGLYPTTTPPTPRGAAFHTTPALVGG